MDSCRQLILNALINTTIKVQRSWWRRSRGHLKGGKREKMPLQPPASKTPGKSFELFFFFISFFDVRHRY